jgi:hypothetical protein
LAGDISTIGEILVRSQVSKSRYTSSEGYFPFMNHFLSFARTKGIAIYYYENVKIMKIWDVWDYYSVLKQLGKLP